MYVPFVSNLFLICDSDVLGIFCSKKYIGCPKACNWATLSNKIPALASCCIQPAKKFVLLLPSWLFVHEMSSKLEYRKRNVFLHTHCLQKRPGHAVIFVDTLIPVAQGIWQFSIVTAFSIWSHKRCLESYVY